MRMLNIRVGVIVAASLALAACTVANPFGGPPLVLTGNYATDLPSITAYRASLVAGVKADALTLQGYFNAACPYVADAQSQLPAAQQAAAQIMTASAAAKQAANVATALTAAQQACSVGTATNMQSLFTAAVDAFEWIYGMVKNGQG